MEGDELKRDHGEQWLQRLERVGDTRSDCGKPTDEAYLRLPCVDLSRGGAVHFLNFGR